jgi:hypothetical protein
MGRYWGVGGGGCSLGAGIIRCVVYGIQLGWGCVVSGLVCSTSSGSLWGCSEWGFLASGFHCVCMCVCVCTLVVIFCY